MPKLWLFGAEGRVGTATATKDTRPLAAVPYRDLLLSRTNLGSWCAYFGAYFGLALMLSWFTPYLVKGLGFDQAAAGKLTALPFVVGLAVMLAAAWLSERMLAGGASSRMARAIVCGFAMCLGGLALIATPYVAGPALKIALIVAGTSLPSVVYVLGPAMLGEIAPDSQRGAVLAINSAVGTSAGILAPYVMGAIIDGSASAAEGYSNGFLVCGIVTLIGALIGLVLMNPEKERAAFARAAAEALCAGEGMLIAPPTR